METKPLGFKLGDKARRIGELPIGEIVELPPDPKGIYKLRYDHIHGNAKLSTYGSYFAEDLELAPPPSIGSAKEGPQKPGGTKTA